MSLTRLALSVKARMMKIGELTGLALSVSHMKHLQSHLFTARPQPSMRCQEPTEHTIFLFEPCANPDNINVNTLYGQ